MKNTVISHRDPDIIIKIFFVFLNFATEQAT